MRRAGGGEESEAARQRREESLRRLERGELPLGAAERLQRATAAPGAARRFTSDLSAPELAVVGKTGAAPLGQVLGSAVYHIGAQWRAPNWRDSDRGRAFGYELDVVTQGFVNARQLALGRLRQEAALLGATVVVGVRLRRTAIPEAEALFEFTAAGTALREPGRPGSNAPVLSNLSGPEYALLRQAGCRPAALVAGNCSYYQIPSPATQRLTNRPGGAWQPNQELPEYSRAIAEARTRAMQRLHAEARAAGAQGVVGVRVEVEVHPHAGDPDSGVPAGLRCDVVIFGTAIVSPPGAPAPAAVSLVLPLGG